MTSTKTSNTATGRKATAMILPPHDVASGEVWQPWGGDARVPRTLLNRSADYYDPIKPRAIQTHHRPEQCPDGRHLFDVIEAAHDVETENEDGTWSHTVEFLARMTCVRCGHIVAWEGTRKGDVLSPRGIEPTPLVSGDLRAQQVFRTEALRNGQDFGRWVVYRGTAPVGAIDWAAGPRGRAYMKGRLDAWPDGATVEGTTAMAVLRKLARGALAGVEEPAR